MDSKKDLNMFAQDSAYCGNFNIWEVCFKSNEKMFRKYENKMRPRGYFLSRTFGSRLISLK